MKTPDPTHLKEIRDNLQHTFGLSRRLAKEALAEGWGELSAGEIAARLRALRQGAEVMGVREIYTNEQYVVVDKPEGIAGHPLHLRDSQTLTHWAFFHYPATSERFLAPQPTLTPHRLDVGTSGLTIVALTSEAYDLWRDRFQRHEVEKTYLALCWGRATRSRYQVKGYLDYHSHTPLKMRFAAGGLFSESSVDVQRQFPKFFLARIRCHTGVSHQVRVHMAELGFPLLGDRLYDTRFESRSLRPPFHLLHATCLRWKETCFESDLPKRFVDLLSSGGE